MRNNRILSTIVLVSIIASSLVECRDLVCNVRDGVCVINEHGTFAEDEPVNVICENPAAIKQFELDWSRVQRIPKVLFETFPNVNIINLLGAKWTEIKKDDFHSAKNIWNITFGSTELENIEDFSFSGLDKLVRIDFRNNKVKTIRRNTFEGVPNLEYLDVAWNQIEVIAEGAFNLPHLQELYLEGNRIKSLQNVFRVVPPLKDFHLYKNELTEIGHLFDGLTELEWINLNSNPIRDLSLTLFAKMPKLDGFVCYNTSFTRATEEDVATAEAAHSNVKKILVSGDQINPTFLGQLRRVFKKLNKLEINKTDKTKEEIEKLIPGVEVEFPAFYSLYNAITAVVEQQAKNGQ